MPTITTKMSAKQFSRKRVMYTPTSVQSHYHVGLLCFVETHRRVLGGKFGRIPAPLQEDAFSMRGYCLDAHELIPAGSVKFDSFGPGDDDWIWSPTHIERSAQ